MDGSAREFSIFSAVVPWIPRQLELNTLARWAWGKKPIPFPTKEFMSQEWRLERPVEDPT